MDPGSRVVDAGFQIHGFHRIASWIPSNLGVLHSIQWIPDFTFFIRDSKASHLLDSGFRHIVNLIEFLSNSNFYKNVFQKSFNRKLGDVNFRCSSTIVVRVLAQNG